MPMLKDVQSSMSYTIEHKSAPYKQFEYYSMNGALYKRWMCHIIKHEAKLESTQNTTLEDTRKENGIIVAIVAQLVAILGLNFVSSILYWFLCDEQYKNIIVRDMKKKQLQHVHV